MPSSERDGSARADPMALHNQRCFIIYLMSLRSRSRLSDTWTRNNHGDRRKTMANLDGHVLYILALRSSRRHSRHEAQAGRGLRNLTNIISRARVLSHQPWLPAQLCCHCDWRLHRSKQANTSAEDVWPLRHQPPLLPPTQHNPPGCLKAHPYHLATTRHSPSQNA